jgi:hypothetical protein
MTLDSIKQQLRAQYQIVDFVDLQEYDQLPEGHLYTKIKTCHKDRFEDNERIVFVATSALKRSYADQPCDILITLQKYIQQKDIPHFFIIMLSDVDSIRSDLDYIHKKYNPKEIDSITFVCYNT